MSTTTSVGSPSSSSIAQSLMGAIDTNGDSQVSTNEFTAFLEQLVSSLTGHSTATGASSGGNSAVATILASITGGDGSSSSSGNSTSSTSSSATAGNYEFRGFDASRAQSAAGTLKYDAYNVLQKYDPADPTSAQKAFQELSALHPGQYELDAEGNIMLTGTADGYIGARPNDRSSDWNNHNQPWNWSWMAYNTAHPGPNGEIS